MIKERIKLKQTIILMAFVLSNVALMAQDEVSTCYAYDDAGNRILRYTIELETEEKSLEPKKDEYFFGEDATKDKGEINVIAYPNPFIDEVSFTVNIGQETALITVLLLDAAGKQLYKGEHQSGEEGSIKVDRQVGVCLLKVVQGNKVGSVKIVGK
ncbi:MAG: T9SS type A sorting domain-containing protein [Flavobacteriales bacterium]|nr:T9SS type A sorting domain-containing protein [Flavobacteriales bacterium]